MVIKFFVEKDLYFNYLANCPTQQWLHESCDNYCRKLDGNFMISIKIFFLLFSLGPHCKNESQLSIIWQKAIAGQTVIKHCPGRAKNGRRKKKTFL